MTSPSPNRRSFLKGTVAAAVGLVAAPLRRVLPAPLPKPMPVVPPPIPAAPKPWGYLEVFTGRPPGKGNAPTGTSLVRFAIQDPPGFAENGRMVFHAEDALATASGSPGYGRIVRYDRRERTRTLHEMDAGVGEGEIHFNTSLSTGGTVKMSGLTIGHIDGPAALEAETADWLDDGDGWCDYED